MAIDLSTLPDVAAIMAPQELEKRRRHGRAAAIAIGAIIVLSDGSECVVTGFDAQGHPLCYPVTN